MRQAPLATAARCTRLAIFVAFAAQGLTFYGLAFPTLQDAPYGLVMSPAEVMRVASFGLVSLGAAGLSLRVFLRHRATSENHLRRSEDFARATVDALPAHIAIVDQWGAII